MLGPKIGLKALKELHQASGEDAGSTADWKIAARIPRRDDSPPPTDPCKGGSSSGTFNVDETFSLNVQAGHENVSPFGTLHKRDWSSRSSSTDHTSDPEAHEAGSNDTLEPPGPPSMAPPGRALAPQFPGLAEMSFSTPGNRFFYEQDSNITAGSGYFGDVKEIYWYNPVTGGLESCVCKTLKVDTAVMQPNGLFCPKARADREVKALRWVIGMPGVVQYRDMVKDANGTTHIILQKVKGIDLTTRIEYRDVGMMGLTWREIRVALRHLAEVLAECHRHGLVHGDVKPENIMSLVDNSGIVLIDFGSASIQDPDGGPNGNGWEYVGGTLMYTAPEVFLSPKQKLDGVTSLRIPGYGPAADCWAFGLTAFKLLTGCPLFELVGDADPSGSGVEGAWRRRCIVDLHADWGDESESRPVHATFREKVQQLAEVSEEFQRDAIDFLQALLQLDPANRLTAEDALHHPFLSSRYHSDALDNMPPDMDEELTFDTTLERQLNDEFLGMLEKRGY